MGSESEKLIEENTEETGEKLHDIVLAMIS
jgi:hypothetical protein